MVDTEIKATFTADTADFTRGTTRAAKDLARVAGEADHAEGQTDDLGEAVSRLAREFSRGAADALRQARALDRMSDETRHTAAQVDQLTGEARKARRELKRLDGTNVEPDVEVGRIVGAFRTLRRGTQKVSDVIGSLGGQIPAVGGGIEKIAAAAPEATIALAGLAAAVVLFAAPFALAAAAAAGAAAALAGLSLWAKNAPGAGPMREAWARVAAVFGELSDHIRGSLVPLLVDVAQSVAPSVAAALENLNTWWRTNAQTVETFLLNLARLGLQGVVAMAHLGQGILGALGPAFAWLIRTIGIVAKGMAGAIRGMGTLFPPLRKQFNQTADDLLGIAKAAPPVADSVQATARSASDALGIIADSAANAKRNMDALAGTYAINVHIAATGDRQLLNRSGIGGGGHLGTQSTMSGDMPAAPAGPAPTGRTGAPVLNLTQPRAAGGTVVNVDARGALGLQPDALAKAVVGALERYEGKNGARWRGGTTRWRIA